MGGMGVPRHRASPVSARRRRITLGLAAVLSAAVLAVSYGASRLESADTATLGTDSPSSPPTTPVAETTTTTEPRGDLGSGEPVTIAFAGDINFEGTNRIRLDNDSAGALGPFAPVISAADLAIGNLEAAIGVGGAPAPKQFTFQAPPTAVDALRSAGFDVVSMANNHGVDYGPEGLAESLAVARAQRDHFIVGIGANEDEAFAPFTTTIRGQRIAVIGATQVIGDSLIEAWTATEDHAGLASAKRVDRLVAEVQAARATNDTVIVFLHWGVEKETCPSGDQQGLARTLVDAGADLVVGGHAHRLQGAGRLGNAVVHYGLGNFFFKENSAAGAQTGVFTVTATGRRIDRYEWTPGRITNSVPSPLVGAEAERARADWEALRGCTGLAP